MTNQDKTKQIGDILRLPFRLSYYKPMIEPGEYVLLSVGETCCLAVVGKNWRIGSCATSTQVYVALADLSLFVETGLKVEPF